MREILFRGKRTDTHVWVEGSLLKYYGKSIIYCFYENLWTIFEVIPETVGQYTGLTDKNGVKIFEGDIVVWDYDEVDFDGSTHSSPELVRWGKDCCSFIVNYDAMGTIDNDCRVIGNIHDNSGLLKRKE